MSSIPKKPNLAEPSLYRNLIPLSKLSSVEFSPIWKTGSLIFTVVLFNVVVVPLTVKFPPNVRWVVVNVFVDRLYVKSESVFGWRFPFVSANKPIEWLVLAVAVTTDTVAALPVLVTPIVPGRV